MKVSILRFSIFGLVLFAVFVASANAKANIIVDVGNPILQANQANQIIAVMVLADDPVQGLNFNFQIDPLQMQAAPTITGVDLIGVGTVFASNNTGQSAPFLGFAGGGSQVAITTTTTAAGTITPNGILGFLTFDTTGFGPATYSLNLGNTVNGPLDFAGIPVTSFKNTTLRIVSSVPEPESIGLITIVALVAVRIRRSKGKRL